MPVIVDGETVVFDSNAILLYLAEKTGQFLPKPTPPSAASFSSWLMFVATGLGPYNGQAVHFQHFADDKNAYAINRYTFEAERHFGILERPAGVADVSARRRLRHRRHGGLGLVESARVHPRRG